ncbi:MAG: hypothetical protein Q9212_004185 [Teloschistes hypoglaucus]
MPAVKRKQDAVQLSSSKPAKKQKQKQPQPAPTFKSAEYVADSDSNGESPRGRPAAKKSALPSAEGASRAHSNQVLTTRHAQPKPTTPRPDQPKKRRHESPVISSTGSEDSESSGGTGSEDEEPESSLHQAKKGEEDTPPVTDSQSSDDEEDDDDDEKDDDDDEDKSESDESDESLDELDERLQQQHIKSKNSSNSSKPTVPYKPPPGFEAANFANSSSTSTSKLFTAEHLRGKEIWHITVPASVPIESIKEVPIDKFLAGSPVFSYKGADYGLIPEDEANQIEKVLLVPSHKDNDYRPASSSIDRTFQLQQIVKPPPIPHKPTNAPNGTVRAPTTLVKTIRQQPEGLKMRFRPFGDESSSENPDPAPRFKLPPVVSAARTTKKPEPVKKDTPKASPHKATKQKKKEAISTKPRHDSSTALDLAWKSSFAPSSKATPDQPKKQQNDGDAPSIRKSAALETSKEKAQRRAEKKQRGKDGKATDNAKKDSSTKITETPNVSSTTKKEHKTNGLPVNGVANLFSSVSVPVQSALKKKPEKPDGVGTEAAAVVVVAANGVVDDAEAVSSKPSEPEKPKVKRRKRKTEITEDLLDV